MMIEFEYEPETGRWIADIPELPGVMAYGKTRADALARVHILALRVRAAKLWDILEDFDDLLVTLEREHEESIPYEQARRELGLDR